MSYECTYCNFNAPTNTRLNRHLTTQKHIRNVLSKQIHDESRNILNEIIEDYVQETEKEEEVVELCENMDCERYPPDWDFEEDTEETYQEDQWKKCSYVMDILMMMVWVIFYIYKKSQITKNQNVVFVEKPII